MISLRLNAADLLIDDQPTVIRSYRAQFGRPASATYRPPTHKFIFFSSLIVFYAIIDILVFYSFHSGFNCFGGLDGRGIKN